MMQPCEMQCACPAVLTGGHHGAQPVVAAWGGAWHQLHAPAAAGADPLTACVALSLCAAAGATTKAGTWAPTEDDAKFLEMMADMEEKWQQVRTTAHTALLTLQAAAGERLQCWECSVLMSAATTCSVHAIVASGLGGPAAVLTTLRPRPPTTLRRRCSPSRSG